MNLTPEHLAIIAAAEAAGVDHTVAGPSFEYSIPDEGYRGARLIEYIELGLQPQSYKGKAKDPCMMVQVAFELFGKGANWTDIQEVTNDAGEVVGKTGRRYAPLSLAVKYQDKAKFKKLFLRMANGRQNIKSMFSMLGEAFKLGIVHNTVEAAGDKKAATYANMEKDGVYLIGPALTQRMDDMGNPEGAPVQMKVPEPRLPLKLFLMDYPTKDSWDSLFIEGSYEVDGKEVSKNRIQEKILASTGFKGSALEIMLSGLGKLQMGTTQSDDLGDLDGESVEDSEPENSVVQNTQPNLEVNAKSAGVEKTSKETASHSDDVIEDEIVTGLFDDLDELEM